MTIDKTRDELFAEYFEDREGSAKVAEHAYRQGWKDRATYTVVPSTTPSPISDQAAGEPQCTCAVRLMPGQIGATHSQDCPITAWGRAAFKASGENAQARPAASENATEFFNKADETFEKWWDRSSGDFPTGFHSWEAACRQAWYAALATAPTTGSAPVAMTDEMRSFIEGMSVSVDVSTSEHDAGNRYFGTVTEVMDDNGDKHGVTLLVQDAKPNFATPASTAASVSTAEHVKSLQNLMRYFEEGGSTLIGEGMSHRYLQSLRALLAASMGGDKS